MRGPVHTADHHQECLSCSLSWFKPGAAASTSCTSDLQKSSREFELVIQP